MHIKNVEELEKKKLFFCKSPNLMKFLTKTHDIQYVKKEKNGFKYTWIFLKTKELDGALFQWSENKKNGTFAFKKEE